MAHWSRVLPLEIHEVANEDLIHDQEAVTRKLIAYCGLEWDERCLAFFNTRRSVQTASSVQVRKPISGQADWPLEALSRLSGPSFQSLGPVWLEASAKNGLLACFALRRGCQGGWVDLKTYVDIK